VEDEGLPVFQGPEDGAARMLGLHARLAPVFEPLGGIKRLRLSERGSWSVEIGNGNGPGGSAAHVELGRGSDVDVAARSERFVRTLAQVTAYYGRPLQYADLRHRDGYVVKLKGISTTLPATAAKKSK
jgi:cell division protein FtsQ